MAEITAQMVKELRETRGAGMMDCKAALVENKGDMQTAQDWLRKKGHSKAAKKAGRVEGTSRLALQLTGLTLVDGTQANIQSQMVRRNGQTSVGTDAAAVATTTGMGAAIGAAADWGRGAAIGAGAGAA